MRVKIRTLPVSWGGNDKLGVGGEGEMCGACRAFGQRKIARIGQIKWKERLLEKSYHRRACRVSHTEQQVAGNKGKALARVHSKVEAGLGKVLRHHTMLPSVASV